MKKTLTIISIVLFGLAAFGVSFPHVVLVPLGLAILASTLLIE